MNTARIKSTAYLKTKLEKARSVNQSGQNFSIMHFDKSFEHLSRGTVETMDPRLLLLLEHRSSVAASLILASLDFWENAHLPQTAFGDSCDIAIDSFLSITANRNKSSEITAVLSGYILDDTVTGVKYARQFSNSICLDLSFAFIEDHYPGASARIKASLALGYSAEEVALFSFQNGQPGNTNERTVLPETIDTTTTS